jgi:hypothetical protein
MPQNKSLSREYFRRNKDILIILPLTAAIRWLRCGAFVFTDAAELALHFIERLPRLATAQPSQKAGEIHQVRDTEKGAPSAKDDLRVRVNEVCPMWGNRVKAPIVTLQQKPRAVAVIPLTHADQRLPAEWMEGMCYPHKTRRSDRNVCILD